MSVTGSRFSCMHSCCSLLLYSSLVGVGRRVRVGALGGVVVDGFGGVLGGGRGCCLLKRPLRSSRSCCIWVARRWGVVFRGVGGSVVSVAVGALVVVGGGLVVVVVVDLVENVGGHAISGGHDMVRGRYGDLRVRSACS